MVFPPGLFILTVLKPQYLAILYTAFAKLPPFDKFKLPPASKLKFRVIKSIDIYGCFDEVDMAIEISSEVCGHFYTIQSTLLHEMAHLALFVSKDPAWDKHGRSFKALSNTYCELYNLDPKAI